MHISVVIPAFNAEEHVVDAIKSVQQQTACSYDITVIDDGSTDHTKATVNQVNGVDYFYQKNQGVSAARNKGANRTKGEWLLFLDADDQLTSDAFEIFAQCVRDCPGFDIYYGQIRRWYADSDKTVLSGSPLSEGPIPTASAVNFFRAHIAAPGAVLISRKLFNDLGGFNIRYDTLADRELYIRAGLRTQFKYCEDVVLLKFTDDCTMSGNIKKSLCQMVEVELEMLEYFRSVGLEYVELKDIDEQRILDHAISKAFSLGGKTWVVDVIQTAEQKGIRTAKSRFTKVLPDVALAQHKVKEKLRHMGKRLRRHS
jgi:glycosyltransferase involved in cell wall biosynthesis